MDYFDFIEEFICRLAMLISVFVSALYTIFFVIPFVYACYSAMSSGTIFGFTVGLVSVSCLLFSHACVIAWALSYLKKENEDGNQDATG